MSSYKVVTDWVEKLRQKNSSLERENLELKNEILALREHYYLTSQEWSSEEQNALLSRVAAAEEWRNQADHEAMIAREDLKIARSINDSFWAALKLLKLPTINVANPGAHVTEVIYQRDIALALVKEQAQLLRAASTRLEHVNLGGTIATTRPDDHAGNCLLCAVEDVLTREGTDEFRK